MNKGGQQDQGRPATVAGHEVIGQNGEHSLPGDSMIRVDIMAAALPESHRHGEGLLAVRTVFEQAVQVKGYPRQIAIVLQQRQGWKEDGHGRHMTLTTQEVPPEQSENQHAIGSQSGA